MIKNIIFDIGGVLVDFNPLKILREMGLEETEVQSIAKSTVLGPHWKELDRGVMQKNDVYELMLKDTEDKYKADAKCFLENEVLKTVTSFDYSADWCKSLKAKGFKIYLLTNYPEWMFDYHWENVFTFSKYIDGEVVSGKVKLIKPDSKIYTTLLQKYNLNAGECVFIDDRQENVEAAEKSGIKGIHFESYEQVLKSLN